MKKYIRPSHPYIEKHEIRNSNTFRVRGNLPLSAEMLDNEFNAIVDFINDEVQNSVAIIQAGLLAGSNDPANADKVLVSTGKNTLWTRLEARHIADGAIGTNQIARGGIRNENLRENSVDSRVLAKGLITGNHIAKDAIDSIHIKPQAITADHIDNKSITSDKIDRDSFADIFIPDDSISVDKIQRNAITSDKIMNSSVFGSTVDGVSRHIAHKTITEHEIQDGAIVAGKLAEGAVLLHNLNKSVLEKREIEAGTVTGGEDGMLAKETVTEHNLADGAVVVGKLGPNSVLADNIDYFAITHEKIMGGVNPVDGLDYKGAITTPKIRDGAVTESKLSGKEEQGKGGMYYAVEPAAVTREKLAGSAIRGPNNKFIFTVQPAVTTEKIEDFCINGDKLQDYILHPRHFPLTFPVITKAMDIDENVIQGSYHIKDGTVWNKNLHNEAVQANVIKNGSITESKLDPKYLKELNERIEAKLTMDRFPSGIITSDAIAEQAIQTDHIEVGAVTQLKLGPRAVVRGKIDVDAVIENNIYNKSVTEPKLGDEAASSRVIRKRSIEFAHLSDEIMKWVNTITEFPYEAQIAGPPNGIEGYALADKSIDLSKKAAPESIDESLLGKKCVGTVNMKGECVTESQIASGAVTKVKIGEKSINIKKLDDDVVKAIQTSPLIPGITGTFQIQGGKRIDPLTNLPIIDPKTKEEIIDEPAVTEEKIKDGSITERKLAGNGHWEDNKLIIDVPGAVTMHKIRNFAVINEKLGSESVTNDKIKFETIQGDRLVKEAIGTYELAKGSVTAEKLSGEEIWEDTKRTVKVIQAVTEEKIRDEAVTAYKIKNKAVSIDKLAQDVIDLIKKPPASLPTELITHDHLKGKLGKVAEYEPGSIKLDDLHEDLQKWFKKEDERPANPDSVGEVQLEDECVVTSKLCDSSVTADKLSGSEDGPDEDRAVTTHKIRDNAITEDKIDEKAICIWHLHPDLIDTFKQIPLGKESVAGFEIKNNTLTKDHFSKKEEDKLTGDQIVHRSLKGLHIKELSISSSRLSGKAEWKDGQWIRDLSEGKPAVTEEKIADNSINFHHLKKSCVHDDNIASESISKRTLSQEVLDLINKPSTALSENMPIVKKGHVDTNAIEGPNIVDSSISMKKFDSDLQEKLTKLFVDDGSRPLKIDSVSTENIKDKSITMNKIADRSVTAIAIKEKNVQCSHLSDGTTIDITGSVILPAVCTKAIRDRNVTTEKLANLGVTTEKIDDRAVTHNKIHDSAVITDKIDDRAVTEDKIADNAVITRTIKDGAVTKDKLDDELKVWFENKDSRPVNTNQLPEVLKKIINIDRLPEKIEKITKGDSGILAENIKKDELTEEWFNKERTNIATLIKKGTLTLDMFDSNVQEWFKRDDRPANKDSVVTESIENSSVTFEKLNISVINKFKDIARSEMQNIPIDAKLIPYEDIIKKIKDTGVIPETFPPIATDQIKSAMIKDGEIMLSHLNKEIIDYILNSIKIDATINEMIAVKANTDAMPLGTIILSALPNPPNNRWMSCNGQYIRKSEFNSLWKEIGYIYGGSEDFFRLPNLQGRVPAGLFGDKPNIADDTDSDPWIGKYTGSTFVELTWEQMPKHTHKPIHYTDSRSKGMKNDWGNAWTAGREGISRRYGEFILSDAGNSKSHTNIQPTILMRYYIKVDYDMNYKDAKERKYKNLVML